MSHKVVIRVEKLKSLGNVSASLSHTYRTRDTPNAAAELADQNTHSHSGPQEVMQAFKDRLPDKRRSDAVLGLEYVVTAHQDWFKGLDRAAQDAYLMDSLEWLRKRHGADNVVGWSIHRDEQAPHLAVYVVPLKDGKLNAKHFTGGKKVLSQLQTDFARDVGQRHGLERGIEGSKAKHTTVKEHYAAIRKQPAPRPYFTPEVVQPTVFKRAGVLDKLTGKADVVESPAQLAERLTRTVHRFYEPLTEMAKRTDLEARRADEMERTALALAKEKKRLLGALEDARASNAELRSRYEVMEQLGEDDPKALEEVHAQAKQRLDMARIRKEFKRRVADLPRLAKDGAGAARTFATKALAAMDSWRTRGGRGVDWKQVDQATFYDHISSPVDVYEALIKHSPRAAEPAIRSSYEAARDKAQQEEQRRLAAQLQEEQRRLAAQLQEEPQRPQEMARPRPAVSRAPRPR